MASDTGQGPGPAPAADREEQATSARAGVPPVVAEAVALVDASRSRLGATAAAQLEALSRQYWAHVPPEDLVGRDPADLHGAMVAHWRLAAQRIPGTAVVAVTSPEVEADGWQSPHTVVQVVADDRPFLVDSVRIAATRAGFGIHLVVHPIVRVERDAGGALVAVEDPGDPGGQAESFVHLEVDRTTDPADLARLRAEVTRAVDDVAVAVADWAAMRHRADEIAAQVRGMPGDDAGAERAEVADLLEWMASGRFTFLGARDYDLVLDGARAGLRPVAGSGLGVLRGGDPTEVTWLSPEGRTAATDERPVVLTKANRRSTVHRNVRLDYVGVKRVDAEGHPAGERRILGLWSAEAYQSPPTEIPVLRRRVAEVIARADFLPGSHDDRDLTAILHGLPHDELFQTDVVQLERLALGILGLQERRRVRVFARRDTFGRFVSCFVFLPRDRYTTEVRERIEDVLREAFDAVEVDYTTHLSESVLARLHFVAQTAPGASGAPDEAALEAQVAEAVRSWPDRLRAALVEQLGEEDGLERLVRWEEAFPPAYTAEVPARIAVADIGHLEALAPASLSTSVACPVDAPPGTVRLKLFRAGAPIPLSDLTPILHDFGVRILDERPYRIEPSTGEELWINEFSLSVRPDQLVSRVQQKAFQEAFERVWNGEADSDPLDTLVVSASLRSADVAVLRAYARYRQLAGSPFSSSYMAEALLAHPAVAVALVELFADRFDPTRFADDADERARRCEESVAAITTAVDAVESLDHDRILRGLLALVVATVRTNAYRRDDAGARPPVLVVKLDGHAVPELPDPRPRYETFVQGTRVEGVHLRTSRVARGGLRWSDRRDDYRTEILGLVKAQEIKNAVIVPSGAKGGFVLRRAPVGRDAVRAEVEATYRQFVSGLLDVTDDRVGDEVVGPEGVVRHDPDDPYLVVAADRGTAELSDVANAVAVARGYWLGDAFASGGSTGYDHKAMGITARGAWESARRHFRSLGVDVETAELTVAGIGDMSGDVFGNGLLWSPHLRLLAAFDHRHVFVDPDPDPAASWAERRRLFELPGSSWDDYDRSVLSPGGGVWSRADKAVHLSPEACRALGVEADVLTPAELVGAVLRAPVDLLWNGGVGTFVKASTESHADVGDRANDAVRIDAPQLRARVVVEGGNLGLTQAARVEMAASGVLVNTDSIDNSAGVDCSDHEVNLKILLDRAVAAGEMTVKQRNALLVEVTDDVAAHVLGDNADQALALTLGTAQARIHVNGHTRQLAALEAVGMLDRRLEHLPDAAALAERAADGRGLLSPELAVVLAVTKVALRADLLAGHPAGMVAAVGDCYAAYFPPAVRERVGAALDEHPLRREIAATMAVNHLVNRAGTTFAFRVEEETGATTSDLVPAFATAEELFDTEALWAAVEEAPGLDPDLEVSSLLGIRLLLERATRWLLGARPRPFDPAAAVADLRAGVEAVLDVLPELLADAGRPVDERVCLLVDAGLERAVARRLAVAAEAWGALDVVAVAARTGRAPVDVATIGFLLDDRLGLARVARRVEALPRTDRWETLARAALRNDLVRERSGLVAEVVQGAPPGADPESAVEAWLEAEAPRVARWRQALVDAEASGPPRLSVETVAVRFIRGGLRRRR